MIRHITLEEINRKKEEYKEELTLDFILNNSMVKWHSEAQERAYKALYAIEVLKIVSKQGTLMLEIEALLDYSDNEFLTHKEKMDIIDNELSNDNTLDEIMINLIVKMDSDDFHQYKLLFRD